MGENTIENNSQRDVYDFEMCKFIVEHCLPIEKSEGLRGFIQKMTTGIKSGKL